MSNPLDNIPQARSWRDIPQPVKPRTMSREGRWRLAAALARISGVMLVVTAVAWGGWTVMDALDRGPKKLPAAAKALPVKHLELTTDGMLDEAWLRRTLALPKAASLAELDLEQLRARLLTQGQVFAASLTRRYSENTLAVKVTERSPVARLHVQFENGEERALLVARDGVVFDGVGFDPAKTAAWPWLDGVTLARQGDRFQPIAGMAVAAELLAKAQLEAGHLYQDWHAVSLARLASDRELEVRTKQGALVVFGADADFFLQLAKLNDQMERFAAQALTPAKIDLSLGREVTVTLAPRAAGPGLAKPAAGFSFFHPLQPEKK